MLVIQVVGIEFALRSRCLFTPIALLGRRVVALASRPTEHLRRAHSAFPYVGLPHLDHSENHFCG
jgi:hypothetical protein